MHIVNLPYLCCQHLPDAKSKSWLSPTIPFVSLAQPSIALSLVNSLRLFPPCGETPLAWLCPCVTRNKLERAGTSRADVTDHLPVAVNDDVNRLAQPLTSFGYLDQAALCLSFGFTPFNVCCIYAFAFPTTTRLASPVHYSQLLCHGMRPISIFQSVHPSCLLMSCIFSDPCSFLPLLSYFLAFTAMLQS